MYSVLLVDDEPMISEQLVADFPWPEYGFDRVETASSGRQALEILQTRPVDILITDVQMPGQDGISILQYLHQSGLDTRAIVLSGYDWFDYVREAMRLGAENYLLKPNSLDELQASVVKALENLEQARQVQLTLSKNEDLFRQNTITRWLLGDIEAEELCERADIARINVYCAAYICVLIAPCGGEPAAEYATTVEMALNRYAEIQHIQLIGGTCVLLVGARRLDCCEIRTAIKAIHGVKRSFTVVSAVAQGSEDVCMCFRKARALSEAAALFEADEIMLVDEQMMQSAEYIHIDTEPLLTEQQEERAMESALALLKKLAGGAYGLAAGSVLNELRMDLLRNVRRLARNGDLSEVVEAMLMDRTPADREALESWFLDIIRRARKIIYGEQVRCSPIVERVRLYAMKHLGEPISLKQISGQFRVTNAYLGYLFKQETGEFFTDYVNNLRFAKAEHLLTETDERIERIAEKTGFSSLSYFSRCFRKRYGITPLEYRQKYADK